MSMNPHIVGALAAPVITGAGAFAVVTVLEAANEAHRTWLRSRPYFKRDQGDRAKAAASIITSGAVIVRRRLLLPGVSVAAIGYSDRHYGYEDRIARAIRAEMDAIDKEPRP